MAYVHLALLAVLGSACGDFRLTLLHTNDMHARFEPTDRYSGTCADISSPDCYGGFARLKAEVTSQRQRAAANNRSVIFLNAGDSYQGTPYYTFFKWQIVSKFVNMLGIDVMCLGNHEFDGGPAGLAPFIANSTTPIVCANLNATTEPELLSPNLTPSKVITINGYRIGIIGYLTPDVMFISNPGKVKISDEIESIRSQCKLLSSQNVTIIIALGHSGYLRDLEIAKEVDEVDVVVGGHSHTFLYTGIPPDVEKPLGPYPTTVVQASGKQVPVVQAYFATKYLGYVELDFDDKGNLMNFTGLPILLKGTLPQDKSILEALKPYNDEISSKIHHIVGYSDVLLNNRDGSCRLGECNIGNLITDAFVYAAMKQYPWSRVGTKAVIGLIQAGGIRASIDTTRNIYHNGSITLGDTITVLPFGNNIEVVNMNGSTILSALEFSVSRYSDIMTQNPEFLQVSGLKVLYDIRRQPGQRVVSVYVLCASCDVPKYKPLALNETFGVVLPQFLAGGGDGFSMFKYIQNHVLLDLVDYETIASYLESHSPIYPAIEGRVTVIAGTPSAASTLELRVSLLVPLFIFCIYYVL